LFETEAGEEGAVSRGEGVVVGGDFVGEFADERLIAGRFVVAFERMPGGEELVIETAVFAEIEGGGVVGAEYI
jgi:hypothetical protein